MQCWKSDPQTLTMAMTLGYWDIRGVSGGPLGRVGWRRAGICCAVGDRLARNVFCSLQPSPFAPQPPSQVCVCVCVCSHRCVFVCSHRRLLPRCVCECVCECVCVFAPLCACVFSPPPPSQVCVCVCARARACAQKWVDRGRGLGVWEGLEQ